MSHPTDFTDCAALITGASSGIGAACARELARRGARLLLTGRNAQRGDEVVEAIRRDGGRAEFVAGDVRDRQFCAAIVDTAVQRFSRLDLLVNNAGIYHSASGPDTTDAQWDATIETNLSAVFFLSRAALRPMREQRHGCIVNVASDWGLVGGELAAAYCASKGAVVLLTKAMALDHAREGVRVNAVCPTDTDTPMMLDEFRQQGMTAQDGARASASQIPLGRMASAGDVAQAVCFLASEAAGFLTGVALPVDGGTTGG